MVLDDLYAKERALFHLEWLLHVERRHDNVLQSALVHIALNPEDVRRMSFGAGDAAEKHKAIMATAPQNGLEIAQNSIRVYLLRDFIKPGMPSIDKGADFLALLKRSPSTYASSTAFH